MTYKRTLFLALVASLGAMLGTWVINQAMLAGGNSGEFCRGNSSEMGCTLATLTTEHNQALTLWYFAFFAVLMALLCATSRLSYLLKNRRTRC